MADERTRGVYDILKRDGYTVSVVQQPLTGLDQDVAATKRVLERQDGDIKVVLPAMSLHKLNPQDIYYLPAG